VYKQHHILFFIGILITLDGSYMIKGLKLQVAGYQLQMTGDGSWKKEDGSKSPKASKRPTGAIFHLPLSSYL
jgi:hypothetical protein